MDSIPVPAGAELEYTDFARSRREMVTRTKALSARGRKGINRLKVAQSIVDAFDAIGGITSYAMWAQGNPTDFYKQYAKLAPSQADLRVQGEFVIKAPLPRNAAIDGEFEECDPKVSAETTSP